MPCTGLSFRCLFCLPLQACVAFAGMQSLAPYSLDHCDLFSTALWHMKKEVRQVVADDGACLVAVVQFTTIPASRLARG